MESTDSLRAKTEFIAEYAARLMGSGVHTSRVVRNSKRIGGAPDIDLRVINMLLMVMCAAVGMMLCVSLWAEFARMF